MRIGESTIAATCAAVTPASILYTREGIFKQVLFLPSSPNRVMVDTSVITKAPREYLVSGIFDALPKWYEGRVIFNTIKEPDTFTFAALKLAQLLNHQMEEKATRAIESTKVRKADEQVRDVIDLNIYVTGMIQGLGFFHSSWRRCPSCSKWVNGLKREPSLTSWLQSGLWDPRPAIFGK